MKKIIYFTAVLCFFLFSSIFAAQQEQPLRSEVDQRYTWDLSELYDSDDAWRSDIAGVNELIGDLKQYNGRLSRSAAMLYECLALKDTIDRYSESIYLYAKLNRDIQTNSPEAQARWSEYSSLQSRVNVAAAFIETEIARIPAKKLKRFLKRDERLFEYEHYLDNILRRQKHRLGDREELLFSEFDGIMQEPYSLYNTLFSEIDFTRIPNEDGDPVIINRGASWHARRSQDRDFRKRAHQAYFSRLNDFGNTFTQNLNTYLKSRVFTAGQRGYSSALAAAYDHYNLPLEMYDNLLESVNANLAPLHRWMKIKKELLGYDTLYFYDTEVSLFPKTERTISFNEGMEIIYTSLDPLGQNYLEEIRQAQTSRWIDAFPTRGKQSAGYSSGPNHPHPFVKVNWRGSMSDLFTLTHELGHFVHAMKTMEHQPKIYRDYPPFLGEIASTTAENIAYQYMIDHAKSDAERIYYIEQYLNNTMMIFYVTSMMAQLEIEMYDAVENGKPMSLDRVNDRFRELNRRYFGPAMSVIEPDGTRWISWAHFYFDFYVYSYATSYAASTYLAEQISSGVPGALEKFLALLKAGNSDYPFDLLKKAGVDLTRPEPIAAVAAKMNRMLDELENLLSKKGDLPK